jgi:hypothetical protein
VTLDALGSLMFLAGFLAAIGLGLAAYAGYQHFQIIRYLRRHQPRAPGWTRHRRRRPLTN